MAFYDSGGTELGSDREDVRETFLAVGQSRTWTEYSSTDTPGHASPIGQARIPNGSAWCQLVETTPPTSSHPTTTASRQDPLAKAMVAANPQLTAISWHVVSFACQGS